MNRHPWCEDCQEKGKLTKADEVHHKVKVKDRPDLMYVEELLMGLCKRCHSVRTQRGE